MDSYTQVDIMAVIFFPFVCYISFVCIYEIKSKDYIESDTLIIPTKKLVIVNNQVDTIYQYKIK